MRYADWKAVYIDKTKTLEDWRKAKDAEYKAKNEKTNVKTIRGLGSGNKISFSSENIPPHILGKMPNLTPAIITATLEKFESRIAESTVENAIIITENGEIWHCAGDLNGIPQKYFDQMRNILEGAHVTHNHPLETLENDNTFSDDDFRNFEYFKLATLRGIDKKFVYELNRNAQDNELAGYDLTEIYNLGFDYKDYHVAIMIKALINGYGYRRWVR